MTMRVHQVADIFPEMSGAEYAALRENIREFGQREPAWVWRGQLVDGRHRARACADLGIELQTREYDGDESSLVSFVVSLNLHRRHLDESQRAIVAARLANLPHGVRADASIDASAVTQRQAAELLNVSRPSVQRAREVLDHGAPELVAAVERGEVSVSAAASVAQAPADEQAQIVAEIERRRHALRFVRPSFLPVGASDPGRFVAPSAVKDGRMSIALMTAAWKREGLTPTQKLVLLSLTDSANDQKNKGTA